MLFFSKASNINLGDIRFPYFNIKSTYYVIRMQSDQSLRVKEQQCVYFHGDECLHLKPSTVSSAVLHVTGVWSRNVVAEQNTRKQYSIYSRSTHSQTCHFNCDLIVKPAKAQRGAPPLSRERLQSALDLLVSSTARPTTKEQLKINKSAYVLLIYGTSM